ncbi:metallophosphoesterase family protein [Paenibacillus eucommiae]|uniref:Serine/threonine protein phosphatase 1 n=1 Tax=Paenibacillus eucommiae TaxID=1355755 RepID=A0ABS4IQ91_9BACL|nr:metallophosphoesterase family protein [Paenibacillus eucommiae]MBP1989742.1 serine/threonine protein phosphatase 1 [Paenibacillus eucommiae]
MKRIIMISDIHGCMDSFHKLLNVINYNRSNDQLILLGDYVDRGPRSREVVEQVISLVHTQNVIALRGNHDQRLVDLIRLESQQVQMKFLEHGGRQTLQSYCEWIDVENIENMMEQAISYIKETYSHHIDFLSKLPLYYEDSNHIYVHAGLNPRYTNWKEQPEHDFMYIKGEFIQSKTTVSKKVIFGHTRTTDIHGTGEVWFSDDKIGIDGGCSYGTQLNALIYKDGVYLTERINSCEKSL